MNHDRYLMTGFAQILLGDSTVVPMLLLRRYRSWFLDEKSLVILLRILGPLLRNGKISSKEIMAEFDVEEEDISALLHPLLENQMLSLAEEGKTYSCPGLLRYLYEGWLEEQRPAYGNRLSYNPLDSRERIRSISRLYRRFEVDLGRTLKYSENEKIRAWIDDEHYEEELIEEALNRAVLQGKANLAYMDSILQNWRKKGLLTLAQVQASDEKPEKASRGKVEKKEAEKDEILLELEKEMLRG